MIIKRNQQTQSVRIDRRDKLPDGFQEASNNFNLGHIINFEKVSGNMNKNYSVTTENNNQFIFKALVKHSLEDLKTEIIYLRRLREHNFSAAYYVEDIHGSSIFKYGNNIIIVQPKLKGTSPSFTTDVCFSIGQNIAKLHLIPRHNLPERDHWLKNPFLSDKISLIQSNLPDQAQRFQEVFDSLADFEYLNLPTAIVHGDLYASNCLYDGNNLVAILDWEEVGIAPAILDLGTCVFNFCFEDDIFHPKLYKTMIDGYQRYRPLNKLEKESINLAIKYVALTLSSWRLIQFGVYNPDPVIVKKSEIYWKIGLDHLQLPII